MLPGMQALRAAKRSLESQELQRAAEHVWTAIFHKDDWPELLREQADRLVPLLLKHGPIQDTVPQLSAEDGENLRQKLLALIEAAEREGSVASDEELASA